MSTSASFRDVRMLRAARSVVGTYGIQPVPDVPGAFDVTGGTRPYRVQIDPDWRQSATCTCPDATQRSQGWCKHVIAVLIEQPSLRYQLLPLFLES